MAEDDAVGAEQEVAAQRQRRGDGAAKEEDEHHVIGKVATAERAC